MSIEENRIVVRRYFSDLLNKRDLGSADRLLAPDVHVHDPTASAKPITRERFVEFLRSFAAAFPDYTFTVAEEIAEHDKVVVRWTLGGTHHGEFLGMRPTGRPVTLTGIDILEVKNGRIVDVWVEANVVGLLRQLGALPTEQPSG